MDGAEKESDSLVQITLHFADNEDDDEDEDDDEEKKEEKKERGEADEGGDAVEGDEGGDEEKERLTTAEKFQKRIMSVGAIASATGNVIVEFSKEQVKYGYTYLDKYYVSIH
jgi:hypothetical protein